MLKMAANNNQSLTMIMVIILLSGQQQVVESSSGGLDTINVVGRLCCTQNGTCTEGAALLPNVNVTINCSVPFSTLQRVIAFGITDRSGAFNITGSLIIPAPPLFPIPCTAGTLLPIATCPPLATATANSSRLVGALQLVSTTVSSTYGYIGYYVVTAFARAP